MRMNQEVKDVKELGSKECDGIRKLRMIRNQEVKDENELGKRM